MEAKAAEKSGIENPELLEELRIRYQRSMMEAAEQNAESSKHQLR
jgi:hypothetical protein